MTSPRRSVLPRAVLALLLAGWFTLFVGGCAPRIRYVNIDTKPTGATLYVDGEKKGITRADRVALDFDSDPKKRTLIQIVKPRYKPVFQYWTFGEVPKSKVFTLEVD